LEVPKITFVLWENGGSLYVGFEGDCKPLRPFFTCHKCIPLKISCQMGEIRGLSLYKEVFYTKVIKEGLESDT
jgi:hypothetical protein